jgi:lysophospholipase L1-like esterase
MKRTLLALLAGALLVPVLASAQLVDQYAPPRANCCLPATAKSLADQLQDWNQLGRYYADNQRLMQLPPEAGRVVFMGDSITDGWKLAQYFAGKPYVNRGISGQTTPQMLVRVFPDVIALKPAAIIVLAGTNDIASNTGPSTLKMIEDNLQAMTELAQAHGITVILCTLTPISDYTPRKQSAQRPPADILKLNAWIKEYAASANAIVADYFAATVDDTGMLKQGFSGDGLHPNDKGYALMVPVAEAAIAKAVKK